MSTVLDELPLKGSHDDENVARPAVSLRTWLPICWSWILRINCLALLLAAIVLRCWELGTIPGINGDEAWYGVQVMQILHGEAFSFTTPTGNLANPFYFLPLLALHSVFEPSFTLLRVVALVSGLAALLVNYWLCNKTFGRKSAVVSTLILAILPINIAYSRFGWDTSQSLLFTLPPIYLSLLAMLQPARRVSFTVWTIVSFAAAIVVHPTNLLIAPWLLVMLVYAWRDRIQQILPTWQKKGIVSLILLTAALMALGGRLAPLIERTHDAAQFGLFTKHLGHLFSGVSTYEFISGSMLNSVGNPDPASPERIHSDAAMIVVLALVAWPLYRRVRKKEPLDI
ncbi:MAG: glycosyltransferase family 39 protein, partial [Planctomycetota bacterium]|nr:glycosyltransferase family 39 protein [Planctomycetota bacterium]